MIHILKNNFERIKSKKSILFIACIIMPLLIGVAIFLSVHTTSKEVIAVSSNIDCSALKNKQYDFITVDKEPLLSELARGKYVAYVEKNSNDTFHIVTLKNKQDKLAITTLFKTGKLPSSYKSNDRKRQERGIATNIFGFITMLILIQGVALMTLYPEDRLNKTFSRIMCSSISGIKYLFAQFIFTFIVLFVPTFIAIWSFVLLFHVDIGLSISTIGILLSVLNVFAIGFSLFICSILNRNTNLVATGISLITCILSGCFIPISTNSSIVNVVLNLIPQTRYMDVVHKIEFGNLSNSIDIIYILLFALCLLILSFIISQLRVYKGKY